MTRSPRSILAKPKSASLMTTFWVKNNRKHNYKLWVISHLPPLTRKRHKWKCTLVKWLLWATHIVLQAKKSLRESFLFTASSYWFHHYSTLGTEPQAVEHLPNLDFCFRKKEYFCSKVITSKHSLKPLTP